MVYVTSLGGLYISSNQLIACDRPLVYLLQASRPIWANLGVIYLSRRCCQPETANPVIRIRRFNVKKYLHIRQQSLAGFAVFVKAFFLFSHD